MLGCIICSSLPCLLAILIQLYQSLSCFDSWATLVEERTRSNCLNMARTKQKPAVSKRTLTAVFARLAPMMDNERTPGSLASCRHHKRKEPRAGHQQQEQRQGRHLSLPHRLENHQLEAEPHQLDQRVGPCSALQLQSRLGILRPPNMHGQHWAVVLAQWVRACGTALSL